MALIVSRGRKGKKLEAVKKAWVWVVDLSPGRGKDKKVFARQILQQDATPTPTTQVTRKKRPSTTESLKRRPGGDEGGHDGSNDGSCRRKKISIPHLDAKKLGMAAAVTTRAGKNLRGNP